MRNKKNSLCGPYFHETFQQLDDVRNSTTSHESRQGWTPSQLGPSHISCRTFAPTTLQAIAIATTANQATNQKASTKKGFFKHSNAFARPTIGSLTCSSHKSRRVFVVPRISSLCGLDRNILHTCPRPLSLPKGFSLFDFLSAFELLSPYSFLCSDNTALPILPLLFLCRLLGRRRASPHRPAAVSTSQIQRALR